MNRHQRWDANPIHPVGSQELLALPCPRTSLASGCLGRGLRQDGRVRVMPVPPQPGDVPISQLCTRPQMTEDTAGTGLGSQVSVSKQGSSQNP